MVCAKWSNDEARICLNSLALAQIAYHSESNAFVVCAPNPGAVPGVGKMPWNAANADFSAIGFQPKDGNVHYQYASASADTTIKLWDTTDNYRELHRLEGHHDEVLSITFSPDGKLIATGSHEEIKLWRIN